MKRFIAVLSGLLMAACVMETPAFSADQTIENAGIKLVIHGNSHRHQPHGNRIIGQDHSHQQYDDSQTHQSGFLLLSGHQCYAEICSK